MHLFRKVKILFYSLKIMIKRIGIILFTLLATVVSDARILKVMVTPGHKSSSGKLIPEPLSGKIGGMKGLQREISDTPGVKIDDGRKANDPHGASVTYKITFSDHPKWGDISFDLTLTAQDGYGTAGLLYNGVHDIFWTVDTGDNSVHGTSPDEENDEARIRSGESIKFKVHNVRSEGNVVKFVRFTGLAIARAGTFDCPRGVFRGADEDNNGGSLGGRINKLQFLLAIEPKVATIPEPRVFAFVSGILALGCVFFLRRNVR